MAFTETVRTINSEILKPEVPLESVSALRDLANGFMYSRERPSPLYGCVGALDVIAIAIRKPPDEYIPRNFHGRKGMYALPVHAVVDRKLLFLYMVCRCSRSTHDAAAFDISELAAKMSSGAMKHGYWIAREAAYVPMPGLLTP